MTNFYTTEELRNLGIATLGENVKISKKATLYGCEKMYFGSNVRIDDFCVLSGKLIFGDYVHITAFCLLAGADEGIFFDDFTTVAYRSAIFTRSDDYLGETLTNSTIPEKYRYNTIKQPIHIRKHAIVGAGSIVFPGADLAEGVSVGALSLVAKPTKPWGVYLGSPARRIKDRQQGLLAQEQD
ncbi:MAG: acyltransferase, partial [Defluviitaleaceae bacterium]|nr:acyltransferase [Defluviitaleaceae bacterium]